MLETDRLSTLMCIKIDVLFSIIFEWWEGSVESWLVQLASLTMVACSNDRWQRSKIQQCKLQNGALQVNHKKDEQKGTIYFN